MYLQNNDLFTIQSEICRSEAVVAVEVVDAVAAVAVDAVEAEAVAWAAHLAGSKSTSLLC